MYVFTLIVLVYFFIPIACHTCEYTKKIIQQIYPEKLPIQIGQQEIVSIEETGGSPIYGEITIDGAHKLLQEINMQKDDVFYDVGSGFGKFVVQTYLETQAQKCVGIEMSKTRYAFACKALQKLQETAGDKTRTLAFFNQNMLEATLEDATVIYISSTCFSSEFMQQMAEKCIKLKKVRSIFTLKRFYNEKGLKQVAHYKIPMSWGNGKLISVYEFRKE